MTEGPISAAFAKFGDRLVQWVKFRDLSVSECINQGPESYFTRIFFYVCFAGKAEFKIHPWDTHSSLISYRLPDNSFLSLFLIIIHLYKPVPCSRKLVPIQSLLKFLEVPREFDLGLASILYFNKYSLYLRGSSINLI